MSNQRYAALGFQFFLMGGFAWIAAALIAVFLPTVVVNSNPQVGSTPLHAPNIAAAGAALGFGIGGGLCFLGAAFLYGKVERIVVPPLDPAPPATTPGRQPASSADRGAFASAPASALPQEIDAAPL
jgi:hypothetical protein